MTLTLGEAAHWTDNVPVDEETGTVDEMSIGEFARRSRLWRRRPQPRMEGRAGAAFCIWWSQVSEDSDGPLEWCRPVPDDRARELAGEYPELMLRTEPAHHEAFVKLGYGAEVSPAQWQLVSESLHAWGEEHAARPSDLGVRLTYLVTTPPDETRGPDCDFAVPFETP